MDEGPGAETVVPPRQPSARRKGSAKRTAPREIKEYTFAMIKPHAVQKEGAVEAILAKIEEAGFQVAHQDEETFSTERVEAFYAEHKGGYLGLCLLLTDLQCQARTFLTTCPKR